jgi:metal-sulfur cluster biosynthetic enzyme
MKRTTRRSGIAAYTVRPAGERGSAEGGSRPGEPDGGQAVEPDGLDQAPDVRLRAGQPQRAVLRAKALRQAREVDDQRGVGEPQLRQVDDDVARRAQRDGDRTAAAAARRAILVPGDHEDGQLFIETDDRRNLLHTERLVQGSVDTIVGMVDEEEVTEALSNVIDPELGLDFVELGLVYGVEIDGGTVTVTFTLTTPACPIGPQVSEQMQEFVGEIDGVEDVVTNMVFTPPWSPDKMSEDAKFALGY